MTAPQPNSYQQPGYPPQGYPQQPAPYPPHGYAQPMPAYAPQQAPIQQARSGAQYVRQQTGHSLTKHLLFGMCVLWINVIYYSMSPNHYWHF